MRKFLLLLCLSCPVYATMNGQLVERIGDELYFDIDTETYDCESFEDIKKQKEEDGKTVPPPTTVTGALCRLLGTRTEAREALDELAGAIGAHEAYVLTPKPDEDDGLNHIPTREGFLTEENMRVFAFKEKKENADEEKRTFFYRLLNPLYTGQDIAEVLEKTYVVNTNNTSDQVEKNVKRNNELLFSWDVQAKSLAELSFEKSLTYDMNASDGIRALCKGKKTLQEKLRCGLIYQMMMAKTIWEIIELSNFASGVTSKKLIEGVSKKSIFKWQEN